MKNDPRRNTKVIRQIYAIRNEIEPGHSDLTYCDERATGHRIKMTGLSRTGAKAIAKLVKKETGLHTTVLGCDKSRGTGPAVVVVVPHRKVKGATPPTPKNRRRSKPREDLTVLLDDDEADFGGPIVRWTIWRTVVEEDEHWKGGIVGGRSVNDALVAALSVAAMYFDGESLMNIVANGEDLYCETLSSLLDRK